MIRILEKHRAVASSAPPALFRYDPPVSGRTLAAWQRDLDAIVPPAARRVRLVLRWEPGDLWQPVQRFIIWMGQDPRWLNTEPWVVNELRKSSPRSNGHYCGVGYCLCDVKKNRWVGGVAKFVDRETWRLYRDTGLAGWRWWTIQGHGGGHRFQWRRDELAARLSVMKGGPADTPAPGDLPYAPFDRRVIAGVLQERRASDITTALERAGENPQALSLEDRREADAWMKALMEWSDERAYALWHDGAELLPRYLEDQYGRVPVGSARPLDCDAVDHMTSQA